MIFKKPKMKYTEMAIFIDEKTNSENDISEHDIELIYKYLYHLIFMLAHKQKYFNRSEYYEEFALWYAEAMVYRLMFNPKLKEYNEDGTPKLKKIKSILNYLKSSLYGAKVAFEQQYYSQKITKKEESPTISIENSITYQMRMTKRSYIDSNIKIYLTSLAKTLDKFIERNCLYKKDEVMLKNIKISCFLSLLNSITFTESDKIDILNKYKTPEAKFNYLCKLYKLNRDNSTVLYHLTSEFEDYITIMVRRMFSVIEADLKNLTIVTNYVSDDIIADIIFSEINSGGESWQVYNEN